MKTPMKDKHFCLNQAEDREGKKILGAKTETEAVERALNFLIERYSHK